MRNLDILYFIELLSFSMENVVELQQVSTTITKTNRFC